jgi:hypothetical protein
VPPCDPVRIFERYNDNFENKILVAASVYFDVFGRLAAGPLAYEQLRDKLGLAERPMSVLVTALRAFGLIVTDARGLLSLSEYART